MNDDPLAKTGRVMFLLTWIILFAFLFVFFYYHERGDSVIQKVSSSELILKSGKDGHYRVQGKINDYPVNFLIDTGASMVAIPKNIAQDLHLEGRYPIQLQTANGEVTGMLTRLRSVSLGQFTLNDVKAVITPDDSDDTVLLGMNVLSEFHLIQKNNELVIKP